MGEREYGEGSIYQRKDRRYVGQYTIPTLNGTKKKYIYGKDKKEVRTKLTKAIADKDAGLFFDRGGGIPTA
jgi:integrase